MGQFADSRRVETPADRGAKDPWGTLVVAPTVPSIGLGVEC